MSAREIRSKCLMLHPKTMEIHRGKSILLHKKEMCSLRRGIQKSCERLIQQRRREPCHHREKADCNTEQGQDAKEIPDGHPNVPSNCSSYGKKLVEMLFFRHKFKGSWKLKLSELIFSSADWRHLSNATAHAHFLTSKVWRSWEVIAYRDSSIR